MTMPHRQVFTMERSLGTTLLCAVGRFRSLADKRTGGDHADPGSSTMTDGSNWKKIGLTCKIYMTLDVFWKASEVITAYEETGTVI